MTALSPSRDWPFPSSWSGLQPVSPNAGAASAGGAGAHVLGSPTRPETSGSGATIPSEVEA